MYRTNAQSRLLEETFIRQGMPYLLVRGTRFYDRKEIKDMLAYLRLLHNPADNVSLNRIINVPPRNIGGRTIDALDQWANSQNISPVSALLKLVTDKELVLPFTNRAKKSLTDFGEILLQLMASKDKLTLPEFFDMIMGRAGYKNFIKDSSEEGEERWENLTELRRSMTNFGALMTEEVLGQFLENVALVADSDMLTEENKATALLTLHTAKGLEFPIVFMVGMEEGLFPHSRSAEDTERMEEERRLAYVGVTRAMDKLYLTRAFRRQRGYSGFYEPSSPSRFLADIPTHLLDDDNQRRGKKSYSKEKSERLNKNIDRVIEERTPPRPLTTNSSPKQTITASPSYKAGETVYHAKFGEGKVVAMKLDRGEEYVQIAFPGKGVKTLAASIAPLERR
jgi:DNA helicase-2/ATP-dependent DNA helicase PcrA